MSGPEPGQPLPPGTGGSEAAGVSEGRRWGVEPDPDAAAVRADLGRAARTGDPEVVFAEGKTPAQAAAAVTALVEGGVRPALVTRASEAHAAAITAADPAATFHTDCGVVVVGGRTPADGRVGRVAIVTAGTSDLRVARECQVVLEALGEEPRLEVDVGVAGLHRILDVRPVLEAATVVVVVAGMEAALAPVVAGLVPAPVVAVPTSVGYGAAQGGLTALHGLLAACTPGIAVVNVDNGLGAALLARRILAAAGGGEGQAP
jgi:pyridinium-3,5-biscarboxylic acid mononucleotide synthase